MWQRGFNNVWKKSACFANNVFIFVEAHLIATKLVLKLICRENNLSIMVEQKSLKDQKVDVNFESHPPIEDDLNGVASLLRQSLLQFVDCNQLASYLVNLKDTTQVIAQETPEDENVSEDEDPDDDIYGVVSVIDLPTSPKVETTNKSNKSQHLDTRNQLLKFLKNRCPKLKEALTSDGTHKYGLIVNERYINLPPQLALPTLKALTETLDEAKYTHLIFISKILVKDRHRETKLPSKKTKSSGGQSSGASSQDESLVYVNSEEEIIFENCAYHTDIDVSAHCDENVTWSFSSDIKYIPHRRIMVVNYEQWPKILKALEEELK